jgi:hypothetical protein
MRGRHQPTTRGPWPSTVSKARPARRERLAGESCAGAGAKPSSAPRSRSIPGEQQQALHCERTGGSDGSPMAAWPVHQRDAARHAATALGRRQPDREHRHRHQQPGLVAGTRAEARAQRAPQTSSSTIAALEASVACNSSRSNSLAIVDLPDQALELGDVLPR